MSEYWAPTQVTVAVLFKDSSGNPTDPANVELKFKLGSGAVETWTYQGLGAIVRTGTGAYQAAIRNDGTYGGPGPATYEWIGTDNTGFGVANVGGFKIDALPL